jgi:hypothetical protein
MTKTSRLSFVIALSVGLGLSVTGCSAGVSAAPTDSVPKICKSSYNRSVAASLNKFGTDQELPLAEQIGAVEILSQVGWDADSHSADENNAKLLEVFGACLNKEASDQISIYGVFN